MALLVTDQGEIDSLRTLLSATHTIPRNLVLKLYTAPSTAPVATVPTIAILNATRTKPATTKITFLWKRFKFTLIF